MKDLTPSPALAKQRHGAKSHRWGCLRKLAHLIYGVITSGTPFNLKLAGLTLDSQDGS